MGYSGVRAGNGNYNFPLQVVQRLTLPVPEYRNIECIILCGPEMAMEDIVSAPGGCIAEMPRTRWKEIIQRSGNGIPSLEKELGRR